MTNKEAIMILESIQPSCGEKYSFSESEIYEAIDMAIEALNHSEIPNSSDCIDRSEAQTAIQFAARRYTVAHEAHGEGHVVWSDNLISVTDAMNVLREVPPAQPEQRCVNCGRTINNGGWYEDGRTRCPIEEHYALPKDGYCHLWEKVNVWNDNYPEEEVKNERFDKQTGCE